MYVAVVQVPAAFNDEENWNRFFSSFAIIPGQKKIPQFSTSPDLLFTDLLAKDSATFAAAESALSDVQFTQKDIPLLLQKSLLAYPDGNFYDRVNDRLLNEASKLLQANPGERNTVINFVRNAYQNLDTSLEFLRYPLLQLLAKDKTKESYAVVNDLFFSSMPRKGSPYSFFYALESEPALAKTFYPQLLEYTADTTIGASVISLTNTLLDSLQLTIEEVSSKKSSLIKFAEKKIKDALKYEENEYDNAVLLQLLSKFKDATANAVITRFLAAKSGYLKNEAAIALIKNKVIPSAIVLEKLAAEKEFRSGLYNELKAAGVEKSFPAAYRSQKSMAEGYIYEALVDEDEIEEEPQFVFIKKMDYSFQGAQKRFYLYRVNFKSEDTKDNLVPDNNSYLAIAGPFELDASVITIDPKINVSGTYFKSTFDGSQLDAYFKRFIEERIKYFAAQ